jgi:RHS repeat-associated protein
MDGRHVLEAARKRVLSAVSKVSMAAGLLSGRLRSKSAAFRQLLAELPPAAWRLLIGARRRWRAVLAVACALSMAAGITIAALPGRTGVPGNSGILPPGSQGSLPHHSWWDPRGWFGSNGAPSSHVLAGSALALPSHRRMPAQAVAPPLRRVAEITAKRSQYSRTYLLSNGQQQATISTVPVNYRTPSGQWAPISTQLTGSFRPGFVLQDTANTFSSFFGSQPGQQVRFEMPGGGWVSMGFAGTVAPQAHANTVTYAGIAPGVSVSYQVTPVSLVERVTLASRQAAAAAGSLSFTLQAGGGLSPYRQRDGSIALSRDGAGGAPVLVIPAPVMTDAHKSASSPYGFDWSPKVSQQATWDPATGTMQITVTPDAGWLDQPGTAWPVVIDPTITIAPVPCQSTNPDNPAGCAQNSLIEQDAPSTNYLNYPRLSVGTTDGAARALLSFPLSSICPQIGQCPQISSADLNLYYDQTFGPGTANQTVNVYQATSAWNPSTVTWNTGPTFGVQGENQVTVDDSDTADTSASGSWPSQASSSAVGGEYLYNQDTVSGDTFTWVPQITESGSYQVEAHYVANSAAASNAPYTVTYNGGSQAYTVNQQSGSGGVWTTLGTQSFLAGTAGKVVLGDGPATATTQVEADAVRFTKYASDVVNPNVDNIWDSFSVRNIVQSWLDGSSVNDGFVVKAADESALNVGGPRYEASGSFYNGETATYPQLVVTYGLPSVTLNPITTINATGADLSWTPYTDPTPGTNPGDDLARYMVYRSADQTGDQTVTPSASTLISPVAATQTSFDDTSAPPTPAGATSDNAVYYMVAVQTQDGTIVPGPTRLVQLPAAGHTTQIFDATGAITLSSAQPATSELHLQGQPWVDVGDNSATYGVTRSVFSFPSLSSQIPAGSTVTDAHLQLWGFWNNNTKGGSATYEAHALTQGFDPATATWNDASSGTPWTTAGGTYNSTIASSVTGLTNAPGRQDWPVTSIAQDWLNTPADQYGLLLKLSGEGHSSPQELEIFTDTSAPEPALAPELVVTYLSTTAEDTYYAPSLPHVMTSNASFTTPVTLTNTTSTTWDSASTCGTSCPDNWVLSYHWVTPDGTDMSPGSDPVAAALPATMKPGDQVTLNATVQTPDTSSLGASRMGCELEWDLWDMTNDKWLSSLTDTPDLTGTSITPGTVGPLNQVTSVTRSASDLLGLEKYFQYTGINTGAGSSLLNNDDTGNVVWSYNAFTHPSTGFQTFVRMAYNSMDTSESSMGFGFSLQASTLTRLGTPLDFHPNPNPTTITLTDGDGTSHEYTLNSATNQWTSPPGFHYFLTQQGNCDPSGETNNAQAWLITAPDRTKFYFDCAGYETSQVDKNGNTATFTYTSRRSENKPEEFLDYITDPAGRQTLTITYYAKGQDYSYIDASGNVAAGTDLTNPDIIGQIQSVTDDNGRTIELLYNVQGEMAQMIDGFGTAIAKTFKFGYDATQGNKNVKLVAVTDPRGNTTNLAYYTAPQDPTFKWSLETVTDRMNNPATSFAYTVPSGGGIQTTVTDPRQNTTTYLMDTSGRPVQVTNAKGQVTKLTYDSDNNITSLTEDNGAKTTWTWDQNTGYPLTMHDAQANNDGTAGYTYTYNFTPGGHTADLASELTPQQRLWKFGYDANGNLTSVISPLGNVPGAPNGSFTTTYTYDSAGNLLTAEDPDGNTTQYSDYDANGYPQQIMDPVCVAAHQANPLATCKPTSYTYDPIGDVLGVTDPLNDPTSQTYDVFGRPLQKTVAKCAAGQPGCPAGGVTITTPAPVYDGNDNITQTTTPDGAPTTYSYNANDQLASKVTPPDTPTSPAPTTTYSYDPNGNLATVTRPNGNLPGAALGSYTTTYGYDAINERTSVTDANSGLTQYGYDDVGNLHTVTDPDNNVTTYVYNLNHQVKQVTDAAGNCTLTGYDLDGLQVSQSDSLPGCPITDNTVVTDHTTLDTLDPNGQLVQQEAPAQAPGQPVSYDVTQYLYDQAGHQTQVLTPRAVAAGFSTSSACVATATCPFTWVTRYNADSQVAAQVSAYNPADPNFSTPSETDYSYDDAARLVSTSAPPSAGQTIRNITGYSYFQNGWLASTTDPTGITTSYDYNGEGQQSLRTLTSLGGDMTRSQSWGYFPDGKLASTTDNGVPTGLYSELVDNTDPGNTSSAGTWTHSTAGGGFIGSDYQTDVNGTASDSFTWNLHVPADGSYKVSVLFPAVSSAVTNASYTVNYSGGSATVTVDQTQHAGQWVDLGTWPLSASSASQSVSLAGNSGGTVVADAVKAVRDNSGDNNTAKHVLSYGYDSDGNQTSITDTSNGTAVPTSMTYDQLDRQTGVTEDNSAGTAVHTTTYGYDAASNLTTRTHDLGLTAPSYATYRPNNLNQLASESDGTSATDPSPQVTTFTYTPDGQTATEVKPNGNTLTDTYFANNLLQHSLETTTSGATVAEHTYGYDPNGDMTSNAQTLMSADPGGGNLTHTLTYAYDPMDWLTTVTTDGIVTESYTHDPNGNVTSQTLGGQTTSYTYDQNRLMQATTGGATSNYNYDPLGRLDTVTSGTTVQQSNVYDGFDNLVSQTSPSGTTSYTYDSLNRMATQTSGGTTTSFSYLGLSSDLATESQAGNLTKSYTYTPSDQRLSQTQYGTGGTATTAYYTYNSHSDVEALTGSTGSTTATYGYTAYGQPVASMFTGADKNNINPSPTTQPYNSYRYNAMRWDSSTGQYDMGFRTYDPGLNQFLSRDMYNGALDNMGLTTDPFTGSPYAFGEANPVSNIELDGHVAMVDAGGGGTVTGAPYQDPSTSSGCGFLGIGCVLHLADSGLHAIMSSTSWLNRQVNYGENWLGLKLLTLGIGSLRGVSKWGSNWVNGWKDSGQNWWAQFRAGWYNKPIAYQQGGKLNVAMPSGDLIVFGGIKENNGLGRLGEFAEAQRLQAEGIDYQAQVTFYTENGVLHRVDFLTRNAAQELKDLEVKTGMNPVVRSSEIEFFKAVDAGENVYPVGGNAEAFGLESGEPVKLSGWEIAWWEGPEE